MSSRQLRRLTFLAWLNSQRAGRFRLIAVFAFADHCWPQLRPTHGLQPLKRHLLDEHEFGTRSPTYRSFRRAWRFYRAYRAPFIQAKVYKRQQDPDYQAIQREIERQELLSRMRGEGLRERCITVNGVVVMRYLQPARPEPPWAGRHIDRFGRRVDEHGGVHYD